MRKLILLVGVVAGVVLAQSRRDTFDVSGVRVDSVHLVPLADGGCSARWCGAATSEDGGVRVNACTDDIALKAAGNVNKCNSLADTGVNRLARELRLDADAGVP